MSQITAASFWAAYREVVRSLSAKFGLNEIDDSKTWTNQIANPAAAKVIQGLGLVAERECRYGQYLIDCAGWIDDRKKLAVAFEHENAYEDWKQEVAKLGAIPAPLRVLVAYHPPTERSRNSFFSRLKKEVDSARAKLANWHEGEWLFVCGPGERPAHPLLLPWRAYLLDKSGSMQEVVDEVPFCPYETCKQ